MKRTEKATRLLIVNGYDEKLAAELPKLFIADFFEKEQDKLSEDIDIFIDRVQRGCLPPNEKGFINFAYITKMEKQDFEDSMDGLFCKFSSFLEEEFFYKIKRLPLRNILKNGGAFDDNNRCINYFKPIVGTPQEYADLCEIQHYYNGNITRIYIRVADLYLLLKEKGFSEDMVSVSEKICIDYNSIMNLGKIDKQNPLKM